MTDLDEVPFGDEDAELEDRGPVTQDVVRLGDLPMLLEDHGALTMDGYDHCIVGLGRQGCGNLLVVYDRSKILNTLMQRDGMNYSEAVEFHEFNQVGAYVGESTPFFLEWQVEQDRD